MSIESNMSRWIHASISQYFETNKGTYYLVHPGQQPTDTDEQKEWAELRVDGPQINKYEGKVRRAYVEINIFVSTVMGSDTHAIHKITGHFQDKMAVQIPIYRYGDVSEDPLNNDDLIGCLMMTTEQVESRHMGQMRMDVSLRQAIVEGRYYMFFEGD